MWLGKPNATKVSEYLATEHSREAAQGSPLLVKLHEAKSGGVLESYTSEIRLSDYESKINEIYQVSIYGGKVKKHSFL